MQENELVILWTSGVKKIQIANLFFFTSLIVALFYLLFSFFLTPYALNKSRMLLAKDNLHHFYQQSELNNLTTLLMGLLLLLMKNLKIKLKPAFL